MKIKVYDKILELMGRDGCKSVGSKVKEIFGFNRIIEKFKRRFREANKLFVSRL
jgi:hypothetical protein